MSNIEIELSPHDIADGMSTRDMIQFVKDVDEAKRDWGFTIALADYFDEQRKIYAAEEEANKTKVTEPA